MNALHSLILCEISNIYIVNIPDVTVENENGAVTVVDITVGVFNITKVAVLNTTIII